MLFNRGCVLNPGKEYLVSEQTEVNKKKHEKKAATKGLPK